MNTIDVVIDLLNTGKTIFQNLPKEEALGNTDEAIIKIIEVINLMIGYDRSNTTMNFIQGKINIKNAILRLVVDEPKEPMTPLLKQVVNTEQAAARDMIPLLSQKRVREGKYDLNSCLEALRRASMRLGPTFTRIEYLKFTQIHKGYPYALTITKHCESSSWDQILVMAGLQPKRSKMAK
jgi:hypothetical protein